MSTVSRWSRSLGWLLVVATVGSPAAGQEPWLVVHAERPARLLDHELVANVREALAESPDYRDRLQSPEVERLRELARVVEDALDVEWEEGLDKLFRRGRLQAFDPTRPRSAVIVIESDVAETLRSVLVAVAEKVPPVAVLLDDSATPTVHPLGKAFVARDGARLVVAGEESLARAALAEKALNVADNAPLLSARIDVARFREQLNENDDLRIPGADPGAVATVGGWLERIRFGRELNVTLDAVGSRLELSAELSSESTGNRVPGFFAPSAAEAPRPIRLPNTILSFGWYRDFGRMWEARRDLVEPDALERMEKRDEELQSELGILGITQRPSELFGLLGSEYHVVVTRDEPPKYDVPREIRLPHAAFVVSLRDAEAYEEAIGPVFRFLGVILSGQQKMLVGRTEHAGDTINTARFRDDANSQQQGNVLRYHFAPSWSIARGHLVVGSTDRVVTGVLDELRRRETEPADETDRPTESVAINLAEAAAALRDAGPLVVTQRQLADGLAPERAEAELRVAETILNSVETLRVRTDVADSSIRVRLSLGPENSGREEAP